MLPYIMFTLGVIFGSIVSCAMYWRRTSVGTLKIDKTDPEKDKYQLVIDDLDTLSNKKRVILKIDSDADLSQN